MPSLSIIKSGLMTSIQDMGRKGWGYYAIPRSGVMDSIAARQSLLLCRLDDSSPIIECTMIPPKIQFEGNTQIVVTGADFNWQINGYSIERNKIINIKSGDILHGEKVKDGLRGYIAIRGKLHIEKVYDSYATHQSSRIGGLDGNYLKKGDVIKWTSLPTIDTSKIHVPPQDRSIIEIKKGPEFDYLTDLSKFQLTENIYTVNADSNRMGARLDGESIDASSYQLTSSRPVLPGFIQLPPSGKPIILLNDGQTTGGYPRIAYMDRANLDLFNQIGIGESFKFKMNR